MPQEPKRYVTVKFLMERYEISRETIYKYMRDYGFPKQHKLTPGATRWLLTEVEAWESERAENCS
ncbi:helix-turn-helix transcriptional regulator [Primorskyibacter sp. 2E233]|uniref:helix-turn-helix transcriptional regulator n=1 Tax=Primorskyibacter sp. 2E233 TaxID=3413431 RepID=UPI003BF32DFB